MKIGKPVVKAMGRDEPDDISSDCALTGHHIAQGMAEASLPGGQARAPAEPGVYRVRSGVTHMTTITKNSLLTLEAYAKIRKTAQPDFIADRKLRTACTWASASACSSKTSADDPAPDPGDAAHRENLR